MKTAPADSQDTEILVEAIEKLLRQVTRLIVGRLGFPKYLSLIRKIFVEEAENALAMERHGRNVTMSELGLLTGIDTRTLAKIRRSDNYQKPIGASKAFFTDLTPESAVVDTWSSDPAYRDPDDDKPRALDVWGSENSFEALVKSVIKSRGITVQSILNRLADTGAISFSDDEQVVRLHPQIWFAYQKTDAKAVIQSGLFAVGKHLDTVRNNIRSVSESNEPRFERIFWSVRIDPRQLTEFRTTMSAILEKSSQEAFAAIVPFDENFLLDDAVSGGVGFYYFDSETD